MNECKDCKKELSKKLINISTGECVNCNCKEEKVRKIEYPSPNICMKGINIMAFDGIVAKSVVTELNNSIINGKINKIYEVLKDYQDKSSIVIELTK